LGTEGQERRNPAQASTVPSFGSSWQGSVFTGGGNTSELSFTALAATIGTAPVLSLFKAPDAVVGGKGNCLEGAGVVAHPVRISRRARCKRPLGPVKKFIIIFLGQYVVSSILDCSLLNHVLFLYQEPVII
jgi:hypothetical protein